METNAAGFVNGEQAEELSARLKAGAGDSAGALEHYERLLERNSANYETYYAILALKGVHLTDKVTGCKLPLDAAARLVISETMAFYAKAFPRVNAHQRIALKYMSGAPGSGFG